MDIWPYFILIQQAITCNQGFKKVHYHKNDRDFDTNIVIHHFYDKEQIVVNSHRDDHNQCCNTCPNQN